MLMMCGLVLQCLASWENLRAETMTNNCPHLARGGGLDVDQWHPVHCPKVSVHKIQRTVQALIFPVVKFSGDRKGHKEAGDFFCWIVMRISITTSRFSTVRILTLEKVCDRVPKLVQDCVPIEVCLVCTCSEDFCWSSLWRGQNDEHLAVHDSDSKKNSEDNFCWRGLVSRHKDGGSNATINCRTGLKYYEKYHQITVRDIKIQKRMR